MAHSCNTYRNRETLIRSVYPWGSVNGQSWPKGDYPLWATGTLDRTFAYPRPGGMPDAAPRHDREPLRGSLSYSAPDQSCLGRRSVMDGVSPNMAR